MIERIYYSKKKMNGKKLTKIDKLRRFKRYSNKCYIIKGYDKKVNKLFGIHNLFSIESFKLHKNEDFLGYIDNTKK